MADGALVLKPGDQIGRYRVTRLLGRGSTGSVYLARQPVIDREVAVKVLLHLDEASRARFLDEARRLALTEHQNIVEIFDVGEDAGRPFMVMRYIEGHSLRDLTSGEGHLPLGVVLRIAATVAGALQHAHGLGIVHGDVKPANVIVAPTGEPVLVDWSPSRVLTGDPELDARGLVGTPGFMAPEQARGEPPTPLSDVWGLGATLFTLVAGRPPFEGPDVRAVLARTASRDPAETLALEGSAPGAALSVVGRCLMKDPAERYASAADLRRGLEAALDFLEFSHRGTADLPSPEQGQTLLLHVEYREADLPGAYREYEIGERLGGGTFGEVFKATEKLSGKDVALKILRREWVAKQEAVARFRREAALLSRLAHPNIVRVYNFGRYGASFFMAMELLSGRTLLDVMADRGPLAVGEAIGHADAVLAGLAALHEEGIVHRDVKPENVAVEADRVVLFDLNTAHAADVHKLTMTGEILGSPAYMSPEQALAAGVTGASDIYSAGVILYEMLAGALPHEDESTYKLLRMIAAEPPVPIADRRPDLPAALVRALDSMLEKDPADRPTAAEAREMLAAATA